MAAIEAAKELGVLANDFSSKAENDRICPRQRHERERDTQAAIKVIKGQPMGALKLWKWFIF